MPALLANRLTAARQGLFVGRTAECALFDAALAAADLPFCVLYIFGPGGIGKTTLLHALVARCQEANVPAIYIDARDVEPTPDAFTQALRHALELPDWETPHAALAARDQRFVLLVDTYETLAPLDDWLRDTFLPDLPANVLLVLAGRQPPGLAWRADEGWRSLLHVVSLRNLAPEEGKQYLIRRGLPVEPLATIFSWTHGHPLALSLVADVFAQRRELPLQPDVAPDVIKTLLERLMQKVPGPAHRTALEACALVRVINERLLAEILAMEDVHTLFTWLRELSFIEAGERGLFPHDLAREAITADLRWRNPDWFAELHRRARVYYARCLQQTQGAEQQRVMFDYVYLHRDNPLVRPFLEWQDSSAGLPDTLQEQDVPQILEMVARHEGEQSARIAAHWLRRQPQAVTVYRDADQQPAGFMMAIELQVADEGERRADPAVDAAWRYLEQQAALRPGECATMFRFWMARDTYQAVSAVQSLIFVNIAQYYMNKLGLAYSFFPCAEPEFWAPPFGYMDLAPIQEAFFTVDGHQYGVFGHDWRAVPPLAWLDLLAERELATEPLTYRPAASTPLVVLSQDAFEDAAREALQHYARPDALRISPLLRSRLVLARGGMQTGEAERVAELRALVRRAAEAMQASPRTLKWYRAVHHTYLQPAATQEQAADLLDIPFSSYRRHLKAGVEQVVASLWQWELQGAEQ